MKIRWFSRMSLVSVALVSSLGVAACSRAQTSGDEGSEESVAARAQASAETQHGPGHRLFRQIDALDLTQDQREGVRDIEDRLTEDLASHRGTLRQVAETLAHGVETGTLDTREAARNQEALTAAAAEARASVASAMNEAHGVLDADQREELVVTLRAQRGQWRGESGSEAGSQRQPERLSKLAATLGLSEEQKQVIQGEVQAQLDKAFPERKAKREAWEAKMQALGDAFMSDDFDAADFDLGSGAEEAIASFTSLAKQAIDVSGRVLDPSQRMIAASLLRARAAEM
jgi:Spy/CpxP family protein refolding chaperone